MKPSKLISLGILLGALNAAAQDQESSGRMLFLHLLQKNGTITVLDAEVVDGTPRERFAESGPQWELTAGGTVTASGSMPAPAPISFDYLDDSGKLAGGSLPADSVEFFVRIPYREGDERINFYTPKESGKGRSSSSQIGTCLIREVIR